MLEPIVVEHPLFWPSHCVQCHGTAGPLLDLNIELHGFGRVYLCASCVRLDARHLGLVKGKRQTELLQLARDDQARQEELDVAHIRVAELDTAVTAKERENADLADALTWARERIEQLEAAIGADAKSKLALIG